MLVQFLSFAVVSTCCIWVTCTTTPRDLVFHCHIHIVHCLDSFLPFCRCAAISSGRTLNCARQLWCFFQEVTELIYMRFHVPMPAQTYEHFNLSRCYTTLIYCVLINDIPLCTVFVSFCRLNVCRVSFRTNAEMCEAAIVFLLGIHGCIFQYGYMYPCLHKLTNSS